MEQKRLNAYRIMWLFVFFDLPVMTKKQKKVAAKFRNELLKDGFTMMQYSVYTRHCPSIENAEVHIKRVKAAVPEDGNITILTVTDKQYGNMISFWYIPKKKSKPKPKQIVEQLTLF